MLAQLVNLTNMLYYNPYLYNKGEMLSLSPIIITSAIHGTYTIKHLMDLKFPQNKIHELMVTFSQIVIKYLTQIILNKRKL